MRTLIQTYRECPELGWGDFRALSQPHSQVLAHRCHWQGSSVLAVHNLSSQPVTTVVDLDADDLSDERPARLDGLLAHEELEADASGSVELTLEGYGHRWFRVRS
jgi:hypothetical protein